MFALLSFYNMQLYNIFCAAILYVAMFYFKYAPTSMRNRKYSKNPDLSRTGFLELTGLGAS